MTIRIAISVLGLLAVFGAPLTAQTYKPILVQGIEDVSVEPGAGPVMIDLRDHFALDGVNETHSFARFDTDVGKIDIELLDTIAPITVANFLKYAGDGDWDNSIIHRSVPGFVIQGGGFTASLPVGDVPADAPIQNEFNLSNTRGTMAMAKLSGDPDSATSEWFFNLSDNSSILDGQNGGFAVFSRVVGNGMNVVDAMAALDTFNFGSAFTDIPLIGFGSSENIIVSNFLEVRSVREIALYPASNDSESVLNFAVTSGNGVSSSIEGSILMLEFDPEQNGSVELFVNASGVNGALAIDSFVVRFAEEPLAIASQPIGRAVELSGSVSLSVTTSSSESVTYQWQFDGQDIPGAVEATLSIENADSDDAGDYRVVVMDSDESVTSEVARLQVVDAYARLVNISTRAYVESGAKSMVAGFVLEGEGDKSLLIRGVGEGLSNVVALEGVMEDPVLELLSGASVLETNDNWTTENDVASIQSTGTRVGAFPLDEGSADSVLLSQISDGAYTARIRVASGEPGIALAEVYDADEDIAASPTRVLNISTRAEVREGTQLMSAGFVVQGDGPINVLIRAVGPGLESLGLSGVLADPKLEVISEGQVIAENDDWGALPAVDSVLAIASDAGAFALGGGSKDAMLFLTLDPGVYSSRVKGVDGSTGIGLIEVYEVK